MKDLITINLIDIKKIYVNNKEGEVPSIYIEFPNNRFILITEKALNNIVEQVNKIKEKLMENPDAPESSSYRFNVELP